MKRLIALAVILVLTIAISPPPVNVMNVDQTKDEAQITLAGASVSPPAIINCNTIVANDNSVQSANMTQNQHLVNVAKNEMMTANWENPAINTGQRGSTKGLVTKFGTVAGGDEFCNIANQVSIDCMVRLQT